MPEIKWALSAEHAGNYIPKAFKSYFEGAEEVLKSHRGYDLGTREIYEAIPRDFANAAVFNQVSRLLIELNRSLHHRQLFSEFSRPIPAPLKKYLIQHIYHSYRGRVERQVSGYLEQGFRVIHIGLHSFTPVLEGEIRQTDIGLLYDPSFPWEKAIARTWKACLAEVAPELRVRFNYPYQGKNDGLTTSLRRLFPTGYAGMEVEVNQTYAGNAELNRKLVASMALLKNSMNL